MIKKINILIIAIKCIWILHYYKWGCKNKFNGKRQSFEWNENKTNIVLVEYGISGFIYPFYETC
jgi:hypothetical protein